MISEAKQKVLEHFAQGRKSYKLMDFTGALVHFKAALELDSSDGPSKVYIARCQHYLENPPPDDWDGVFVMKSK